MEIREVRKVSFAVVVTDIGTFRVWDSGVIGEYDEYLHDWTNLNPSKYGLVTYEEIKKAANQSE